MQQPGADTSILRVGVLADTIDRPGGIARYTEELVAALARRDDVRLVVAAPAAASGRVEALAGARLDAMVTIPTVGQLRMALWERYTSGAKFEKAGVQLVHGTKHLVPRTSLPTVLTVHDLMTITRARESALAKRMFLPRQYRTSMRSATRLLSVSRATRDRIVAIDGRWGAKTVVVPNGLSHALLDVTPRPVPGLAAARFALVVGDLAPRKNVEMLLDLWPDVASEATDFPLVVLGHPGPHSADTTRRLAELEHRNLAIWLRGASDGELRWCYEHATVVLLPTLEEGFGFPLLEALTFGAPSIASTDAALVEVSAASPEVEHLDIRDREAWRRAVVRAAGRPPREPPAHPVTPPGAVSWDENAGEVMDLYRSLVRP
ncbi:MAG TPA: glycosyltransferase family 1 protein [Acidimicrobiia bacterium]|jgi:glycosyltransferase involved in cell wall biosynthesis